MPALLRLLLTHPVGCGGLMALMFSAQLWLPQIPFVAASPALLFVVVLLCMALNFFTPALAAIASLGGGLQFSLQTTLVASLLVFLLPDISWVWVGVFAVVYALTPTIAAQGLLTSAGMARASDVLLLVTSGLIVIALAWLSQQHPEGVQSWLMQSLTPLLESIRQGKNDIPADAIQGIRALLSWTLPGMLLLSLWIMWAINLSVARGFAVRYGFYQGDPRSTLEYRPSPWCAWMFLAALLLANVLSGDLQYLGVTLALLFGYVMAVNGVSVVHLWLRARGLLPVIVMMYVMILFWTMVIFPFLILGLIDVWKDFRASIQPANE